MSTLSFEVRVGVEVALTFLSEGSVAHFCVLDCVSSSASIQNGIVPTRYPAVPLVDKVLMSLWKHKGLGRQRGHAFERSSTRDNIK